MDVGVTSRSWCTFVHSHIEPPLNLVWFLSRTSTKSINFFLAAHVTETSEYVGRTDAEIHSSILFAAPLALDPFERTKSNVVGKRQLLHDARHVQ